MIGSDERCAPGARDYFFAKQGKEFLAYVVTGVMGLERGVIFQVSFVRITSVWLTVTAGHMDWVTLMVCQL